MRIRPSTGPGCLDWDVKKVSNDALSVGDRKFIFDSVFDSNAAQVRKSISLMLLFNFCFSAYLQV